MLFIVLFLLAGVLLLKIYERSSIISMIIECFALWTKKQNTWDGFFFCSSTVDHLQHSCGFLCWSYYRNFYRPFSCNCDYSFLIFWNKRIRLFGWRYYFPFRISSSISRTKSFPPKPNASPPARAIIATRAVKWSAQVLVQYQLEIEQWECQKQK